MDGQEYKVNPDYDLFQVIIIIFHHLKFVQNTIFEC